MGGFITVNVLVVCLPLLGSSLLNVSSATTLNIILNQLIYCESPEIKLAAHMADMLSHWLSINY